MVISGKFQGNRSGVVKYSEPFWPDQSENLVGAYWFWSERAIWSYPSGFEKRTSWEFPFVLFTCARV